MKGFGYKTVVSLWRSLGWRGLFFRLQYALLLRLGWWRHRFPLDPPMRKYRDLASWRAERPAFFFSSRGELSLGSFPFSKAEAQVRAARRGRWLFFSGLWFEVGYPPDWLFNPLSGFRYDGGRHWTEVADFSAEAGDIKFVWELSRFSWLGVFLRYDHHGGEDLGEEVFALLDDWMDANPLNAGPQYRCSQEIAVRVMNWALALYYYAEHPALHAARFERLLHYLYWQLDHIEKNLGFSRHAVRNNHLMAESLCLYLGGVLFPFFPRASIWRKLGKEQFEKEILYQIAEDGSYLQHSHNYHRVVVQLLCWYLRLRELHEEEALPDDLRCRMEKTLDFLLSFMNESSGELPLFGANDGALFFVLSDAAYSDYRPQLYALAAALGRSVPETEEAAWLGFKGLSSKKSVRASFNLGLRSFREGGLYLLREEESTTVVRCASFRHRPAQADNLHVDIWYRGRNVFGDAGSYLYHTDEKWFLYFQGTTSHNTVSLGDEHQMQKGPRFIWHHWTAALQAGWGEEEEEFVFEGEIEAFGHLHRGIRHFRRLRKRKGRPIWEVEDVLRHRTNLPLRQHWHPLTWPMPGWQIRAEDGDGRILPVVEVEGWCAPTYGLKERRKAFYFETRTSRIKTLLFFEEEGAFGDLA